MYFTEKVNREQLGSHFPTKRFKYSFLNPDVKCKTKSFANLRHNTCLTSFIIFTVISGRLPALADYCIRRKKELTGLPALVDNPRVMLFLSRMIEIYNSYSVNYLFIARRGVMSYIHCSFVVKIPFQREIS